MEFSAIGRAALRAREGERLTAYRDSVGVLTISVGVTSATGLIQVKPGLTITAAQSDALFAKAVGAYVQTVRSSLTRPVSQEFFDACVSLCYNIGQGGFARSSVVRYANAGDLQRAADAFLMWNKPSEILGRRNAERDQALTPYAQALPKARSVDKAPIRRPDASASTPATSTTGAPTTSIWSSLGTALSGLFRR